MLKYQGIFSGFLSMASTLSFAVQYLIDCLLGKTAVFSTVEKIIGGSLQSSNLDFYKRLDQWSSRCAPVYTSVHRNYFTVHRNFCELK